MREKLNLKVAILNLGFENEYEFVKIRLTDWIKKYMAENQQMFSQEARFQGLLDRLKPEIKSGSYPQKPRLTEANRIEIAEIALYFSPSFEDYLQKEFVLYCKEQLTNLDYLLDCYQKKYVMDTADEAKLAFDEFIFSPTEKNADLWAWKKIEEEYDFCYMIVEDSENNL